MFKNAKKMTAICAIVIFFIYLDRLLKTLALSGRELKIAGNILKFDFKANYDIAFSLPFSGAWLNVFIFSVILALICFLAGELKNGRDKIALCLFCVIMGASSNLFDRLKYGFVVDYFDLKYFTVFNLADAMIAAGALAAIFLCKKDRSC
ncbi:MAG: signal peptidase II [bacterium]